MAVEARSPGRRWLTAVARAAACGAVDEVAGGGRRGATRGEAVAGRRGVAAAAGRDWPRGGGGRPQGRAGRGEEVAGGGRKARAVGRRRPVAGAGCGVVRGEESAGEK